MALSGKFLAVDDQYATLGFCVTVTGIRIAKDKLTMISDTFCQADGRTERSSGSKFFFTITSQISPLSIDMISANFDITVPLLVQVDQFGQHIESLVFTRTSSLKSLLIPT